MSQGVTIGEGQSPTHCGSPALDPVPQQWALGDSESPLSPEDHRLGFPLPPQKESSGVLVNKQMSRLPAALINLIPHLTGLGSCVESALGLIECALGRLLSSFGEHGLSSAFTGWEAGMSARVHTSHQGLPPALLTSWSCSRVSESMTKGRHSLVHSPKVREVHYSTKNSSK